MTVNADAAERQAQIVAEFQAIADWKDRYRHIIQIGRSLPSLADDEKTDRNRIKGCQSQVWMVSGLDGDRIRLRVDSDADITRGLVALVVRVFDELTPAQILAADVNFIDALGLGQNLSATRANGLSAMIKQVRAYAVGYQALLAMKASSH